MTYDELDPRAVEGAGPLADPDRWESLVGSITAQAEPILAARRREPALADILARWRRPVFSAAATLAAAALAAIFAVPTTTDTAAVESSEPALLAEAIMPTSWAAWLDADYSPTLTELVDGTVEVR